MTTRVTMAAFGAVVTLVASVLAGACDSSGSGNTCFPPEHGPSDPSCAGFTVGLSCPVSLSPWYSCVCTAVDAGSGGMATGSGGMATSGSGQQWVCAPAVATGGGGSGSGGMGPGGSTADASAE